MQSLTFRGRVESGEGVATSLGCPTANIAVEQGVIIPRLGVYIGETELNGILYPSIICINDGRCGSNLKMEVHLLDLEIKLENRELKVILLERTRDLITWESNKQISLAIAEDMRIARDWFQKRGMNSPHQKED